MENNIAGSYFSKHSVGEQNIVRQIHRCSMLEYHSVPNAQLFILSFLLVFGVTPMLCVVGCGVATALWCGVKVCSVLHNTVLWLY